jgi:hypothetical protein
MGDGISNSRKSDPATWGLGMFGGSATTKAPRYAYDAANAPRAGTGWGAIADTYNNPIYGKEDGTPGGYVRATPTYTGHKGYNEDAKGIKTPYGGGALINQKALDPSERILARPDLANSRNVAPQLTTNKEATAARTAARTAKNQAVAAALRESQVKGAAAKEAAMQRFRPKNIPPRSTPEGGV